MRYYIYILRCEDNSLYTGITTDVFERFKKHREGKGAKYTRIHKPIKIELVLSCQNRSEATKIENFIKSHSKIQKEKYIQTPFFLIENILKSMEIKVEEIF